MPPIVEDKMIDSAGFDLAIVWYGIVVGSIEDLEMVDESARHVEDFDVGSSAEVFEVQSHFSVVGVGNDFKGGS